MLRLRLKVLMLVSLLLPNNFYISSGVFGSESLEPELKGVALLLCFWQILHIFYLVR